MSGLLDQMIIESSDRRPTKSRHPGGRFGATGASRVTDTLRAMGLRESLVRRPYIIDPASGDQRHPIAHHRPTGAVHQLHLHAVRVGAGDGGDPTRHARRGPAAADRGALAAIRTGVVPRLLSVRDRTKLVAGAPAGARRPKSGYNTNVKHDAGILYLRAVRSWWPR